jgi:hypothetical protein
VHAMQAEISCYKAKARVCHILHRKLLSRYRFTPRTNNAGAAAQLPGCETVAARKETFRSPVIASLPGMIYDSS